MPDPTIFWFRRDLRLDDHPGLTAAREAGGPVIPVAILDPLTESLGAAPLWRWGEGVDALATSLKDLGSHLVLRKGDAAEVLRALIAETGARTVLWSRAYDPASINRDKAVKSALVEAGVTARSIPGHVLFEPWTVETGQGSFYKVYTPFWKSVRDRDVGAPVSAPADLPAPDTWPRSDSLDDWALAKGLNRGADVLKPHANAGEAAARARLSQFVDDRIEAYDTDRDRLDRNGTSCLSENLALGEISARRCFAAARHALDQGKAGAETFAKEIVWRDFAYHLAYHTPQLVEGNWRPEWDDFPWRGESEAFTRWCQGRTGEPVIDAAMREMYVTGRMQNRARMLVASYLTKHLLTHWRLGCDWFAQCLIDWDPASNAMGWQWAAGTGPDAAPYFRVFNPATQADKFDPGNHYRTRWVAELARAPGDEALSYFEAIPRSWGLSHTDAYPDPLVDLKDGRERALAAYKSLTAQKKDKVA
ncbi:MAG: deoxyribodipyrimidine photo-lyase [Pseudomonadota bacterium]